MNGVLWIVFGLIAGVLAKFIGQDRERVDAAGIIGIAVLGIASAVLGGFFTSSLFGWDVSSFRFAGLAVAVVGAILLLFLNHLIMGSRRTVRM
jgi:uncharacterized membrane protein YeaQ/YmgE (transglycosylase-associated protein family)